MQAANLSMDWARQLAEQRLKMAKEFDNQASAIREHSTSLTEKTLANTFDFGHKLARLREPQEFIQLQSEFLSQQSQAIADQTKELGQKIKKGADELANTTAGATAKSSRAA